MSEILDREFIERLSYKLEGFTWTSSSTANCRCPICGDSKNLKKKRGYFITGKSDGYVYTCHNCGVSVSLRNFLKEVAPELYSTYIMQSVNKKMKAVKYGMIGDNIIETKKVFKPIEPVRKITEKCSVTVLSLPPDHPAKQYVDGRNLPADFVKTLRFTEDYGKFVESLTGEVNKVHDARIVIPFRDFDGKIIAFQGRSLVKDSTLRYVTTKVNKEVPPLFGLDKVDITRDVYCLEGPIKSVRVDNAIAMAGSSVSTSEIVKKIPIHKLVMVNDNEPRNKDIVNLIEKRIDDGCRVVICTNCPWAGKDADDWFASGATKIEITKYLEEHTFKGFAAKMGFSKWRKV